MLICCKTQKKLSHVSPVKVKYFNLIWLHRKYFRVSSAVLFFESLFFHSLILPLSLPVCLTPQQHQDSGLKTVN